MAEPIDLDEIEKSFKEMHAEQCAGAAVVLNTASYAEVFSLIAQLRAHRAERERWLACLNDQDMRDLDVQIAHDLADNMGYLWMRFKAELLRHRAALPVWEELVACLETFREERTRDDWSQVCQLLRPARAKLEELRR